MGSSLSGRPETLATAAGAPSEANPPATPAPVSPAFPAAAPLSSPATPASRPPASPPAPAATAPLASPAPPASPTTPVSGPPASPAQDRIFKNCWSCRVLSGSALFAAGAYVYLVARRPMKLGYSPGPGTIAQMVFGIGIACWGIVVLTDPKGKAYRV